MSSERRVNNTIYVTVGKDVRKSKQTLEWALRNPEWIKNKFCIVHVHQPTKKTNMRWLTQRIDEETREVERLAMLKMLKDYLLVCTSAGNRAEDYKYIVMESIEQGIVELISQNGITKLVMGAKADNKTPRKMKDIKSKKAIYVREHANPSCHIWFVCDKRVIHTMGTVELTESSSINSQGSRLDESVASSSSSMSQGSISTSPSLSYPVGDDSASVKDEGISGFERYNHQPTQSMEEAETSMQEATIEESVQPLKAESEAIETILRRTRASEISNPKQWQQRTETEELLVKAKEELETIKAQRDKIMEELWRARDQKTALEEESGKTIKELKEKYSSALETMKKYKKERDELQSKFDKALKVAQELRCVTMPCVFSLADIREATHDFDLSLKIGEGGFGSTYKASLHRAQVAVKIMNPYGSQGQGPSEFRQEVEILSKLRHPNIITLIGICPERCALVYEYMKNGNLEERLVSLSWKDRIRIATELCGALLFLHSQGIVHGDIKPSNILLGIDFISKLSDFGISRIILSGEISRNNTTFVHRTIAKGTPAYIDPDFHFYGELTLKSDVYSFGILLLQLLTGELTANRNVVNGVNRALEIENLEEMLDSKAGEWPLLEAEQWFKLARCCSDRERSKRCDIGVAWKVLDDTMKAL